MKCIIYGLYNSHHMPILEEVSKNFPLDYCHIIGNSESNIIRVPFIKECVFDNWHLISESYNIDWNLITPLDSKIIINMRHCEIEALKMMDRKSYDIYHSWSYEKRKNVYLQHLRYWNHVLTVNQFDFYWGLNIPHEVIDYIIACLCKAKNIPCLYFYQWNSDLTYLIGDWNDPFPNLKQYTNVPREEKSLIPYLEEDYNQRTSGEPQPLPFYFNKGMTPYRLLLSKVQSFYMSLLTLIRTPKSFLYKFRLKRKTNKVINFYKDMTYFPKEDDKYFYFPLHLQPELSTSPLAGPFVEQLLIIQMVAAYLPKGVFLFVKDHPFQNMNQRSIDLYKEITSIKNVKLIAPKTNSSDLVKNSLAVVTGTGTTGWEALFLNKNVLLFGSTFYQYCPGIFNVRTREQCKLAIEDVMNKAHTPTREDLWQFLYHLGPNGIEGNIDVFYAQASKITYEQDISNLAHEFTARVKHIKNAPLR